jgi:hypothetical protein
LPDAGGYATRTRGFALSNLGEVALRHGDDRAEGVVAFAEAIALWQATGLADRERAARERALESGCHEDELPPPRKADG